MGLGGLSICSGILRGPGREGRVCVCNAGQCSILCDADAFALNLEGPCGEVKDWIV